jgi:Uma2 family endonuclease
LAPALSIGAASGAAPPLHRFTVGEFHEMARAALFGEDERIELIEGELRDMAPIGNAHAFTVDRLNALFAPLSIDTSAIVHVQNPLRLTADTEVYPDIVLLAPPAGRYRDFPPAAGDAILVVEVADASLRSDREFKAPLYARHGVIEYWIVNLVDRHVEIFRVPSEGQYAIRLTASGDDTIAASALPAARIPVASIW